MTPRCLPAFVFLIGALSLVEFANAATIRVPEQFPTIQSAVLAASSEDTILVDEGVYPENVLVNSKILHIHGNSLSGPPSVTSFTWQSSPPAMLGGSMRYLFLSSGVSASFLTQSFGMEQCEVAGAVSMTIVSSLGNESLSLSDCEFHSSVTIHPMSEAVAGVSHCWFDASLSAQGDVDGANVSVSNCIFASGGITASGEFVNISGNDLAGGGIRLTDALAGGSVADNEIRGSATGIYVFDDGGDCSVTGNSVQQCGTGILVYGQGVYATWISGNQVFGCTTGISAAREGPCDVRDNTVAGCETGIYSGVNQSALEGNTVSDCTGAGLRCVPWSPALLGTVGHNIVTANGSGITVPAGVNPANLTCNDVWANTGGDWMGISSQAGVNGNISEDPIFCYSGARDYRLSEDSPCLNAPGCGQIGAEGQGCGALSSVSITATQVESVVLYPNTPNPFERFTAIEYELTRDATVDLRVFDSNGSLVRLLIGDQVNRPGRHRVVWDGLDDARRPVAPGVYFYRFVGADSVSTRKMVIVR